MTSRTSPLSPSAAALLAFIAAAAAVSTVDAFAAPPPAATSRVVRVVGGGRPPLSMSSEDTAQTEVEKLREKAAQYRAEYEQLSKEMGKTIVPSKADAAAAEAAEIDANTPPVKSLGADELRALANGIDFASGDASAQTSSLDSLVASGDFATWKSAVRRPANTSGMSKLQPFPVALNTLESRTGGKVTGITLGVQRENEVSLDDFKDATIAVVLVCTALGIASLVFLPENVGATFTYLFALIPIAYLGIGSTSPGLIADIIASLRGTGGDDADKRERICAHEAGHFLCGYLCGLPVKGYQIDDKSGVPCVEFHTNDIAASSQKGFSVDEISSLTVVAMSGAVGEIIALGEAKGGQNDLLELERCFRISEEFLGAAKQQDLTRWGALMAYTLLLENRGRYDALTKAFEQKKGLAECVSIVEGSSE